MAESVERHPIQCPHAENETVRLVRQEDIRWCLTCGSCFYDGAWHEPQSVILPGWQCKACGCFNGQAKEVLSACRGCGLARR